MTEHVPQPQPDIFTEARGYDNFDDWLTQITDERLQQIVDVIRQVDTQEMKDKETLNNLIGVAMHFKGNEPMTVSEITKALQVLTTQVVVEAYVRNDVIIKQGVYSMTPDGTNALFTITDKGKELYGNGGKT